MICAGCGCVFCWDDADGILVGVPPARYCSPTCKRRAKRKAAACWSPAKRKYASEHAALTASARVRTKKGYSLYAYKCSCRSWHLTSRRRGSDPADPSGKE